MAKGYSKILFLMIAFTVALIGIPMTYSLSSTTISVQVTELQDSLFYMIILGMTMATVIAITVLLKSKAQKSGN